MMRVHIRRKESSRDQIPAYSTVELLHGVWHPVYVPEDEVKRLSRIERQRESRDKFEENKEEIYTLLANGRGLKYVAGVFHIGHEALTRYLEEESK